VTDTAWDLEPFAGDCGYAGPPFPWDERRFLFHAELAADFFHRPCEYTGDFLDVDSFDPSGVFHGSDRVHLAYSFAACRVTMGTYPISRPGGGVTIRAGSSSASLPNAGGAR